MLLKNRKTLEDKKQMEKREKKHQFKKWEKKKILKAEISYRIINRV